MSAVSLKAVDAALVARYSGASILVDGVATSVAAFIEEPHTGPNPERVYPSVAMKLLSILPDLSRAHSDDDEEEQLSIDMTVSPPETQMRLRPQPFLLGYSLDTWHKDRAGECRDLVQEIAIVRTPARGSMSVARVDGGLESVWVRWIGGMTALDERDGDTVIYHKSLLLSIPVDLLVDSTVRDVKTVATNIWNLYQEDVEMDDRGRVIRLTTTQLVPF